MCIRDSRYTKNGARAAIYLAVAGKLYGMFLVSYLPNRKAASILEQLTGSGTSVLIRSSDFNVTSELVAATYGVPRNIDVYKRQAMRRCPPSRWYPGNNKYTCRAFHR